MLKWQREQGGGTRYQPGRGQSGRTGLDAAGLGGWKGHSPVVHLGSVAGLRLWAQRTRAGGVARSGLGERETGNGRRETGDWGTCGNWKGNMAERPECLDSRREAGRSGVLRLNHDGSVHDQGDGSIMVGLGCCRLLLQRLGQSLRIRLGYSTDPSLGNLLCWLVFEPCSSFWRPSPAAVGLRV